jgi:WD40 repeat protein
LLNTLEGHSHSVKAISFSFDGKIIASASYDNTIKLWSSNGELINTLEGHKQWVEDVKFSPDGKLIASASFDGTIKLWKVDGEIINSLDAHGRSVNGLSFSPDGNLIASAGSDGTIKLWNLNGELLDTLSGHKGSVKDISFSPDGKMIASASCDDYTVRIWKLEMILSSTVENEKVLRGELVETIEGRDRECFASVRFSPDGRILISSSEDIRFWNLHSNVLFSLEGSPYYWKDVYDVSLSPDGQKIALATDSPSGFVWDINGNFLVSLERDKSHLYSICFSHDSRMIASGGVELKLWSLKGALIRTFDNQEGYISSISFSPNGQIIAAAGKNIIKLWGIGGVLLQTLEGHEDIKGEGGIGYTYTITKLTFSPDGQMLASASFDGTIKLWNPYDGVLLKTLKGHTDYVQDVCFSPDGQTIASASDDQTIKLWNIDGEEILCLKGHSGEVRQVKFGPDDQTITSIGSDGIKFWSLNGQEIASLNIYGRNINFTPDKKILIVDKTFFNLDLENLLERSFDFLQDYLQHSGINFEQEEKDTNNYIVSNVAGIDEIGLGKIIDESKGANGIEESDSKDIKEQLPTASEEEHANNQKLTRETFNSEIRKLNPVISVVKSTEQGRSMIMTIGINQYEHWPKLSNAVKDAIGIQQVLIDKLGFITPFEPLLDAQATKNTIIALVEDHLREYLNENDNLVLFFAGHGHTRIDKVGGKTIGETGFLVPVEARGPKEYWSDYIQIDQFLQLISKLPPKHILVIFDSCHSGFALGEAMRSFRSTVRYEQDLSSRISRKVITSARRDQFALDGGPIPGHSLFTGTLIDGLNWGKADLDGNGLITSSELGLFIQQKVGQFSESAQTPDFGSFYIDDRGEMVISLRNQSFDALKARAFSALQKGEFQAFKELVEEIIKLNTSSPESLYLEYRMMLIESSSNGLDRASEIIDELIHLNLNDGIIPLSKNDFWKLQSQLRRNKSLLSVPEHDFPLNIQLKTGQNEDSLEISEEQFLGNKQGYFVEDNFVIQLEVTNPTQEKYYVYLIKIDPEGRISLDHLWQDRDITVNGLTSGETKLSYPFVQKRTSGIYERRLFSSPKSLLDLLYPPPSNSLIPDIDPMNKSDLKNIRMKTIRYCYIQSYEFLPNETSDS